MKPLNCTYCDEFGFCRIYSTLDVDVPCPGNGDCDHYREEEQEDGK